MSGSGLRCVARRRQAGEIARGWRELRQPKADGLGHQRETGAVKLKLGLRLGAGLRVQLNSPFRCIIRPRIALYFPFVICIHGGVEVSMRFDPLEGADPPATLRVGGSQ